MPINQNPARLDLTIDPELNDALDAMVALTGTAKAVLIRQSIAQMLVESRVLAPSAATSTPIKRASGRLARNKRKDSQ